MKNSKRSNIVKCKKSILLIGTIIILLNLILIYSSAYAKRKSPSKVRPIVYKDIIITVSNKKLGVIEAWDYREGKKGKKLWEKNIYSVKYKPNLEKDVQDVFITELKIDDNSLIITNEKGERFSLCLNSLSKESIKNETIHKLIIIKYTMDRTFEIAGTDIKGIKVKRLTEILKEYKKNNPNDEYELVAEIKSTSETTEDIMQAIKKAGIHLKHFWVPVSFGTHKASPKPGFVDIKDFYSKNGKEAIIKK